MRLVTWNIQCGKGCDGVIDLSRIVSVAKSLADADVFCFQEVSDNFTALDGGADQSAQLAALLPDLRPIFGPAVETVDNEGRAASVRQHDAVAFAGVADRQPLAAVVAYRRVAQHAARGARRDGAGRVRSGPDCQHASRISFRQPTPGPDRAAIGLAGRSLDQLPVPRVPFMPERYASLDAGCFQHPLRGFQFRREGYPASIAARFTATRIELSRRLGDLPTGTAAPAHMRHLRSRAMARRRRLPRFCLRHRRSRKPRARDRGEPVRPRLRITSQC